MTDTQVEHPWDGLSREDLTEADELTASECRAEGHPIRGGYGYFPTCDCGDMYATSDGRKHVSPDPSDYMDPPDPRDWQ